MAQIHKRFSDSQVKELLQRYLDKAIERPYIQEVLGIGKRQFFALLRRFRESPAGFTIHYSRKTPTRITQDIEHAILKELQTDKELIEDKNVPVRRYNYSYVRDRLRKTCGHTVSLPTVIDRARKNGFYLQKAEKKAAHDREVLSNYAGELIQHDASYHLWSPPARRKWYLITSIDDYSRFMLHASLIEQETTWTHILAAQALFLRYGLPYSYYVDSHRIFRFVQGRDSIWRTHHLFTDDVDTQWKQVMNDCGVKVIHALSPQAKGKVERPYGWLQDRLVRTCAREDVTDIRYARRVLSQELNRYNHHQVHSTTREIPYLRFQNALRNKQSLFREFAIRPPYQSVKDIFCLRTNRTVNEYRKVSINGMQLKVNNSSPRDELNIRIYPVGAGVSELRFWCRDRLIDVQKLKNADLYGVHF